MCPSRRWFSPKWRRVIRVPDICMVHRSARQAGIGLWRRLTCLVWACRAYRPAPLWRGVACVRKRRTQGAIGAVFAACVLEYRTLASLLSFRRAGADRACRSRPGAGRACRSRPEADRICPGMLTGTGVAESRGGSPGGVIRRVPSGPVRGPPGAFYPSFCTQWSTHWTTWHAERERLSEKCYLCGGKGATVFPPG